MLSYSLPAEGKKRGGIERVAHDLANGLTRRGHQVTVWSADPAPPNALYDARPMRGRRFLENGFLRRLTMGYLGNILWLLNDFARAEVLICHGDSLLLPLLGVPVIRVMHGSSLQEARTATNWLRKILQYGVYFQELITARTQICVAVSTNTCEFNAAVRTVIPNGVDTSLFRPNAAAKTLHPSVLFVGTLGGRKRGTQLVHWFTEHIRPRFKDATLWMVSETGAPAPGVTYFTGATDPQIVQLYQSAWVFASPSTYEGFGLPYLEAMASGTPVVAINNPGSQEVLDHGRHGSLAHSDEDFLERLAALLDNAELRQHWIQAGLRRSPEFSLDHVSGRYEAIAAGQVLANASSRAAAA